MYTPEEARSFLTHALDEAGVPHTDTDMDDLAEALGHLTLALGQAVTYMAELGMDCPAYLELFRDRMTTLGEVFPDWESPTPLAATWELSLAQADSQEPKGVARPLMGLIALLDGSGIPERVLTAEPVIKYLEEQRPSGSSPAPSAHRVRAALAAMSRLSLISRGTSKTRLRPEESEGDTSTVRSHQLVQRATREHRLTRPSSERVHVLADALVSVWPEVERDTSLAQQLRDHTSVLRQHHITGGQSSENWLWNPDGHPLLFRAGQSLGEAGRVKEAVVYWTEMLTTADSLLGSDHPDSLTTRNSLANSRSNAGDPTRAAKEHEHLLADRIRGLGPDHPDTLFSRNNLAVWNYHARNTSESIKHLTALVRDQKRVLGNEHPETQINEQVLQEWIDELGSPKADESPESP